MTSLRFHMIFRSQSSETLQPFLIGKYFFLLKNNWWSHEKINSELRPLFEKIVSCFFLFHIVRWRKDFPMVFLFCLQGNSEFIFTEMDWFSGQSTGVKQCKEWDVKSSFSRSIVKCNMLKRMIHPTFQFLLKQCYFPFERLWSLKHFWSIPKVVV